MGRPHNGTEGCNLWLLSSYIMSYHCDNLFQDGMEWTALSTFLPLMQGLNSNDQHLQRVLHIPRAHVWPLFPLSLADHTKIHSSFSMILQAALLSANIPVTYITQLHPIH